METRRTFLRNIGLSATSLTLGCYWVSSGKAVAGVAPAFETEKGTSVLMNWISIDESGQVTLFNHRSEMGQGTFQAIPQIIAEELEVNMERVVVQYVPASPEKFGPQPQEGSFSIRGWYDQLLRMGASAREMLIEAASS